MGKRMGPDDHVIVLSMASTQHILAEEHGLEGSSHFAISLTTGSGILYRSHNLRLHQYVRTTIVDNRPCFDVIL